MAKHPLARYRNLAFVSFVLGLHAPVFAALVFPVLARANDRTPSSELLCRGLLTLVPLTVPIALGIIALATRSGRKHYAVVGIAVPGLILVLMLPTIWTNIPTGPPQCLSNIKQLTMAQLTYASDYEGCLPTAEHWPEVLLPYYNNETDLLICSADSRREKQRSGELPTSYTMSSRMSGVNLGELAAPGEIALLFDGTQLFGSHGAAAFRHGDGDRLNLGFTDGHAKSLAKKQFLATRLEP